MSVTLLLGRANTGKSAAIYERLAAHQRAGEKTVLIVPEQYTFEAERSLAEMLGGLLGVEVLSFARLNERILTLCGQGAPFLSPQGHRMVIRRSALLHKNELSVFSSIAEKPGFAKEMQTVFSDLTRAGLSPAQLTEAVEKLPAGSLLRGKLADIALLYTQTEAFLHDRYLTLDAAVDCARALLPTSYLAGLPVYIDGIDRPSAQLYGWLSALMRCAKSVTVALTLDTPDARDGEVFSPNAQIASRICELAASLDMPVETKVFRAPAAQRAPSLQHLERNLFAAPAKIYQNTAENITLFAASDRLAETEALADAIQSAARKNVRYRDMAVIVSDPGAYMLLVERVFARRGIPVFLDRKRPVAGHAAIAALLAALNAVRGGFAAQDMLAFVKSGYAGVSHEDVEALELYLLRTGLRGNALLVPFTRGEVPEAAERARAAVAPKLLKLREGLNGRTAGEKVRAVYAFVTALSLSEQLQARAETLLGAGRITLMEEHAQVWNALMQQLDQLDAIMGDVPMGRDAFCALLSEGLAASELGVIPSTSDAVLVGDLARTKSRAVRALFLLGVNDGLLPAARGDDGVIDDKELTIMAGAGMPVWATSKQRAAADRLDLYTALSKAKETLFLGMSFTGDGAELSESVLISDVRRLFPHCRRGTDIVDDDALPTCESGGMAMLMQDLCALRTDEVATRRLPTLIAFFSKRPAYAARVKKMLAAGNMRFSPAPFGRALSTALYGESIRMSASRLEQFAACPCKHFLRYGLMAADTREYTERAADMGTLYHAALAAFVQAAGARKGGWDTLRDEDCDALIDAVLPEILAMHNDGIFLHNERLRATLFLIVESIKLSARAVCSQVRAGAFRPIGAEVRFGEGCAFPPLPLTLSDGTTALLSGVIDRVDAARVPGGEVLRVIDYKLGGRDFDFSGILDGLTLQLPLYLLAASQEGRTPGGMYYMPITMPAASDAESLSEAVAKAFRLKGITLSDASVVLAGDAGLADGNSHVLFGVKRGEDGAFSGSVCTPNELDRLLACAQETCNRLFGEMLDGKIDADPSESACTYCDYRSVCRFDPMVRGNTARKKRKRRQGEFFNEIGGDTHAMDS